MTQSEGSQCPTQWLSDVDCGITPMVQEVDYTEIVKPIVDVYEERRLTVFKQATSDLNQDTDMNMMCGIDGDFSVVKSALGGPLIRRHSIMAHDSIAIDSEVDIDSKLGDQSPLTTVK